MIKWICQKAKNMLSKRRTRMISGQDAALYILSLDNEQKYFNKKLVSCNGHTFYEGNARLNKIIHLAHNMYIGKKGERLIDDDFYAYDNGAIVLSVQENYAALLELKDKLDYQIPADIKSFLCKVFIMLKDAPIEELIEIDHEDPAWQEKSNFYYKQNQLMDTFKYAEDYKLRYEAANTYLDRMESA